MLLTINKLITRGQGLAPVLLKRAASVTLDWDTRQKSRFDSVDSLGRHIGIFLPRGNVVRGGDILVAEDGSLILVHAGQQALLEVRADLVHGSPFDLLRAAYHLGNRHVQLELQQDRLLLEPDHVLADMLRQMHLLVSEVESAFEPESGAYAAGGHAASHDHGHAHGPAQDHGHAHSAAQDHGDAHSAAHVHVHGPGCKH